MRLILTAKKKVVETIAISLVALVFGGAATAEAGLVSYWPLDGDANAVVGTSGTLVNSPTVVADRNGVGGGALGFASTSTTSGSYVSVPGGGGLDGASAGTISMWVKWSGTQDAACCGGTSGHVLGRQSNSFFSNTLVGLSTSDPSTAKVTWNPFGSPPVVTGTTSVGDGVWRHVVVTFQPLQQKVYLDGVLQATAAATGTVSSNSSVPLSIGAWIGDGASYSTSSIDDVAVWSEPLHPRQIAMLASGALSPRDWIPSRAYTEVVAASSPFAYYRFDGDSGLNGSQMTDSSGHGRHGTYDGNVSIEQENALAISNTQAAHFNGTTNRGVGTIQQPTTAMTVEAWAKSDTANWNTDGMLVSKRDAFILHPTIATKSLSFYVNITGWNSIAFDLSSIPGFDLQQWHQYVGVYDPTATTQELQLYVDGILRATLDMATAGAINPSTQPVYIGYDNAGARWFDGLIDEVAIYDHALSEADIFRHFTAAAHIPEPSTFILSTLGLFGLAFAGWRRRKRVG